MLFNSVEFLFLFLPALVIVFAACEAAGASPRVKLAVMVTASFVFYVAWDFRYLPLLLGSIFFNYAAGVALSRTREPRLRRWLFAAAIGINEDPVTGALNAALAHWLIDTQRAPASYVAAQGAAMGRAGRIHVQRDDQGTWIDGEALG